LSEVDSSPAVADAIINAPYSHKLVDGLKNIIVGENPLNVESLWDKMYQKTIYYGRNGAVIHAMAGIDIALWDIKGKFLNLPIYELMGGCFVDKMRVYSSNMFQYTIEDTVNRVKIAIDTGHTAVKFGWEPFGLDEELDLKYVEAIRKQLGNNLDFMLDVGLIWDAKTTVRRAKLYGSYDFALLTVVFASQIRPTSSIKSKLFPSCFLIASTYFKSSSSSKPNGSQPNFTAV
jgi:L-alanine-DL-glutamate epimerase-like enolase superfamily enzyme